MLMNKQKYKETIYMTSHRGTIRKTTLIEKRYFFNEIANRLSFIVFVDNHE